MNSITVLGLVAAACTSSSFLPQVIKSWKTKKTDDVSLSMFVLLEVGLALWLGYGFLRNDIVIILANIFSLACVTIELYFKIRYQKRDSNNPVVI